MKSAHSQHLAGVAQWQSRSFPSSKYSQYSATFCVNHAKNGHLESKGYGPRVNAFAAPQPQAGGVL